MTPSSRAVVRRSPLARATIVAALLLAGPSAISTALAQATGGFIEKADSLAARPRWTPAQIRSFLPLRGTFTFPAPYNTAGVRLTSPSDCAGGDCVQPLGGSSGRNINNHRGRDTMLIFLGLRGSGPTLFGYDKRTDQVRNLGPLFDAASPFASHSGEGWYFSATQPTRLYVSDGGPALLRYDVETRAFETVFDATGQFGEGIGIDQAHSSDDDTVHSALLRDSASHRVLGCLAYREKVQRFSYYPATADGDECEVDKSGRWLLIRQRAPQAAAEDDRIVDLETGAEKTLIGETAAGGPSDTGHGYLVAKDASSSLAAAVRVWDFEQSPPPGRVIYQAASAAGDLRHIAHSNAQSDVELSRQFACGSTGTTPSSSHPGEIVCFRLDGSQDVLVVAQTMVDPSAPHGGGANAKLSNGNLDVTGRYFLWVSNTGGRADAFMVKVPADLLMGPGSEATPATLPTTTAAAPVPAGSLNLLTASTTVTDPDIVVTLSPEDTFLNINATNESTNARLMTYTWPDHEVANAILMKFDLSAIPPGAVVTDARLQLALVEADATADSTYIITAHKVMGRSPVIGAATGYTADGKAAWTPNSCCSGSVPLAQADISAAYDAQAIDKTPGYKSWSLTAMAQEWVADPLTNFGVLLNSDASTLRDRYRFFASMEQVDTSLRPSLTIAYSSKADVTAPVISAVTASAITISGAAISWTTNEPSDSQVEYGTTTAYGSLTTFNKTRVTSHAATLGGLAASTPYHFRVRSRDFAGNLAVSSDFTFTTLADLIPPAVSLTAPTTGTTLAGTVTIAANASDNVGVIGVQFKLDGVNLGAEDTTSPYSVSWSTATAIDGSHALTAIARDAAGNATTSATVNVTVANAGVLTLAPQDTYIGLDATAHSTSAQLNTYTWPDNKVANAILMKFDLSALPAGAVVLDATLQLALLSSDTSPDSTYTVTAHKMVGRSPVITGATGYTADGVTAWTANNCCSNNVPLAEADISAAYDTRAIDKTLGYKSWSLTAMVQEWVASPATNFGLLLNSDASTLRDRYRYFASMENADSALRPSLRVTYSLSPDVTPPVISAVTASALTISGAAINWTTDEPSDSQVEYGTTTAYGTLSTLSGSRVTSHAATVTGLAANTLYHFRVRSRDLAGNLALSGDFTLTTLADLTPPAVSITAPTTGATATGTVTVAASASDNVAVAGVQFKLDGVNLGLEGTTAPYAVSWNSADAANGSHTLSAVARDAAGNVATSAGVTVTVANDMTPPAVSITAPAAGASVSGTITVTASASDNVAVSGVQFKLDGSNLGAEDTSSPYSMSWNTTGVANGSHMLTAVARDAAGNVTTSAGITVTVSNDTTPPSVSITAPAAASTVSGTVAVSANATDNVAVVGVQFKLDGVNLGAEDTTSPYSVSWNTTTAIDGSHALTAIARDAAGNAATSATVNVTVANAGVLILAPQDTYIGLDATNRSTSAQLNTYTWPDNEVANAILMKFDLSALPAGAIIVDATLQLALVSSDTSPESTYTVTAHKVVGKNPLITGATGYTADGVMAWTPSTCCSGNVPLAQADISAAYDTRAIDKTPGYKAWSLTGLVQEWVTNPATNSGLLLNSDASKLADRYRFFASAEYADPTLRPFLRLTYSLTPDVTPPVISAVAASSISASGATINWTTNEASDSQVDYGTTTAYGSLSALNGSLVVSHAATLSGLTANTVYHYRVRSRDLAGNLALSGDFTVTTLALDLTTPTVSITAPAAGATVSGTVSVAASASDNVGVVGVQFKLDGTTLGAEDTSSPYSASWSTTGSSNGSHTLTAVARDAASNQTTSAGVTVTVSNAPPAGIAAVYPGDVGIEADPNVVFVERFDEPTLGDLFNRWTDILNGAGMSWSPDVPAGSPGTHSVDIPWAGGGVSNGGHLYKQLSAGVADTLYVRYYIKYPTSGRYNHTGVWMGGANPPLAWPNPQAGIKPAGNDRFSAAAERSNATLLFDHYDYWMDMHQSNDGNYWGNLLRNDPSLVVNGGQWMCVEHMVKLNNPVTSSNGEHAIWINGVKVSHVGLGFPNGTWSGGIFTQDPSGTPFGGLRWRSDSSLNLNWIWLQNYSPDDPVGFQGHMYFDHLVAARSYIGCLPASGPSDPTPPVVSITAPAAGTTVSGTVAVAASATDNVGVVGVQFKLDGVNLGAEDTASPYSVSWVSSTATNGPHTLTAVARDAAGNQTTSTSVGLTVNNPVSGGILFESNWDTAAGTSSAAVTDGGRWPNYWEFNGGTSVQLLSVVTGGVGGHNALRVQQRGSTFAANLQLDNFAAPSTDYYVRYYMKNDDTSSAGDHIVTADTYQYANLTYLRKVGGPTSWQHYISLYGCGYTYPIGHWTPSTRLANGQWYRFEYYVHYTASNRVQVHPRVYNAAGTLIFSDADFRQSDFGSASWNGRSDWTLASYYAAGYDFCVDPTWMNDLGLGNNGQFGAADTGLYWYFAGLQLRSDTWPGPLF